MLACDSDKHTMFVAVFDYKRRGVCVRAESYFESSTRPHPALSGSVQPSLHDLMIADISTDCSHHTHTHTHTHTHWLQNVIT